MIFCKLCRVRHSCATCRQAELQDRSRKYTVEEEILEGKEGNMDNPNSYYCDTSVRYKAQEIAEDCEDMPEDLSVKHRTVSVQTETSIQDKLEEIFEGFSQNQIKFFMEVLSNFKRPKEVESIARNCENISKVSEKVRRYKGIISHIGYDIKAQVSLQT